MMKKFTILWSSQCSLLGEQSPFHYLVNNFISLLSAQIHFTTWWTSSFHYLVNKFISLLGEQVHSTTWWTSSFHCFVNKSISLLCEHIYLITWLTSIFNIWWRNPFHYLVICLKMLDDWQNNAAMHNCFLFLWNTPQKKETYFAHNQPL